MPVSIKRRYFQTSDTIIEGVNISLYNGEKLFKNSFSRKKRNNVTIKNCFLQKIKILRDMDV